jgi:hypothetical protein
VENCFVNSTTVQNENNAQTGNTPQTGGLVGLMESANSTTGDTAGVIRYSFCANIVFLGSATMYSALVGQNNNVTGTGTVVSSYYKTGYTLFTAHIEESEYGNGVTDSDLKAQDIFAGWDFTSVWEIYPGTYPGLRMQDQFQ